MRAFDCTHNRLQVLDTSTDISSEAAPSSGVRTMNHKQKHTTAGQRRRHANRRRQPAALIARRGSTLLVVIALMGMLSLLGLMFFSFASQEQESSKNYLEAAKAVHNPELDADVYFNWALRQFIRGPETTETQSVLYGSHLSLLANAYGIDAHPHTGKGLTLRDNRTSDRTNSGARLTAFVDLDGDGTFTPGADFADWDQDGISDHLEINRSGPANVHIPGGGNPNVAFIHDSKRFPEPDVDYTYPDINNVFLAYHSHVWVTERDLNGNGLVDRHEDFNGNGVFDTEDLNGNGTLDSGEDTNGNMALDDPLPYAIRIIKPSFWRPELLSRLEAGGGVSDEDANRDGYWDPLTEDANANGVYDTGDFNGNLSSAQPEDGFSRLDPTWYWQPWSQSLTLRAHPNHFYLEPPLPQLPGLPPPPPPAPPASLRYLIDSNPADAAIIAALPGNAQGFPFAGPRDVSTGDTLSLREGVWRGWMQAPEPEDANGNGVLDPGEDRNGNGMLDNTPQYEFDADADNDGIREAILLDLGFPAQYRPSDGALYVPMYALTVYDADGLINLNATGNLAGDSFDPIPSGGVFGNGTNASLIFPEQLSISRSLSALSTFEINPLWGLDGIPDDTGTNPNSQGTIDVTQPELGYQQYFGRLPLGNGDIVNRWEHANMELWYLKKGRIEYGASGNTAIHEGIFGEANLVEWMRQNATSLGVTPIAMNSPAAVLPDGTLGINLFPYPGYFNRDDNRNANYGGATNTANGLTLAFGHPLSVSGRGRFTVANNPKLLNRYSPATTPMSWLQYDGFDVAGDPEWLNLTTASQQLMTNSRRGQLFQHPGITDPAYGTGDEFYVDDPTELILEPRRLQRPADEALSVADSPYLQLAKSDIDAVGVHSRVRDLMPGQIDANDTSVDASARRRRFTTSSWDRKQYDFPLVMDVGPDGRPGNAGVDDDGNGKTDDFSELGWIGSDDGGQARRWEFNVDSDQDGRFEFPPEFPNAPASARWSSLYSLTQNNQAGGYEQGKLPFIPQDPFRPELRRLLEVELGNRDQLKLQFPLNINRLIDVERTGSTGGHSIFSALEFRPLSPHSTDGTLTSSALPTIAQGEFLPPPNSTNPGVREFWARYDRQRMARDIYVLLYTAGSAEKLPISNTPVATGSFYTATELEEMAQFAVNVVDMLDPDNVITIFEYDTDLSNGWGLDDQHWTDEGGDRAFVAGQEAQQLVISESLWVFQPELDNDNTFTPFDETNVPPSASTSPGFHFTQIELRNVSPRGVRLATPGASTAKESAAWRIRWQDTTSAGDIVGIQDSTHTISDGNGFVFQAYGGGSSVDTVNAGGLFTIASSNNTSQGSSDLFVDFDASSTPPEDYELVAPRFGTAKTSMATGDTGLAPNTNLDLVNTGHASHFLLESDGGVVPGTPSGDFLSGNQEPTTATDEPLLILERRANPDLPQLDIEDNPWVVVDYSKFDRRTLVETAAATAGSPNRAVTTNGYTGMGASLPDGLVEAKSWQRGEPLQAGETSQGGTEALNADNSNPDKKNSMMGTNRPLPAGGSYQVIQLHYDRDFASPLDLLSVSLSSPLYATRNVADPFTAAEIFLQPKDPNAGGGGPPPAAGGKGKGKGNGGVPPGLAKKNRYDNRWHRLSAFVDVTGQMHAQLGGPFETTRVPGKINMNTMREAEVLAAVLDSPLVHQDVNNVDGGLRSRLDSSTFGATTVPVDYWRDMLRSRDGDHPDYATDLNGDGVLAPTERTGLSLPGTAFSKPFRSLGTASDFTEDANGNGTLDGGEDANGNGLLDVEDAIQRSIFRNHPDEAATDPTGGGLFDVNTTASNNALRHQLLTKIANNTTTRSNVFFVFIHVQFHEAYEDPVTGAIRVAGRIDLNDDGVSDDGHRGFFVVDRSAAEEAYDPRTGTFDWRQLVKHRLTIN